MIAVILRSLPCRRSQNNLSRILPPDLRSYVLEDHRRVLFSIERVSRVSLTKTPAKILSRLLPSGGMSKAVESNGDSLEAHRAGPRPKGPCRNLCRLSAGRVCQRPA